MEEKILAINCSPRKGNNYTLLKRIPKKHCEIINLYDYNIIPCEGCGECNSLRKCKLKDQFEELLNKIDKFNKIIIATPVYRLDVPSKVKSFIERTSSLLINNKNFEGKVVGLVCIGRICGAGKIQAINTLVDFLLSMCCVIIPPIVVGHAYKINEINNDPLAESSFNKLVKIMIRIKLSMFKYSKNRNQNFYK